MVSGKDKAQITVYLVSIIKCNTVSTEPLNNIILNCVGDKNLYNWNNKLSFDFLGIKNTSTYVLWPLKKRK